MKAPGDNAVPPLLLYASRVPAGYLRVSGYASGSPNNYGIPFARMRSQYRTRYRSARALGSVARSKEHRSDTIFLADCEGALYPSCTTQSA